MKKIYELYTHINIIPVYRLSCFFTEASYDRSLFNGLMGEIMKDRTMKRILEFILSLQCFVPGWKYLQPSKIGLNKGLEDWT